MDGRKNKPLKPGSYRYQTHNGRLVPAHVVIAERALGHPLPPGAVVHHLDGTKENRQGNLCILEDEATHRLIHQRMRAKTACGNPNWRACCYCKQYDDPANMLEYAPSAPSQKSPRYRHRECQMRYMEAWRARKAS